MSSLEVVKRGNSLMRSKQIEKYTEKICEVINGATYNENGRVIDRPRTDGQHGFTLNDNVDKKLKKIVEDLFEKEKWSSKFSKDYIHQNIWKIILGTVGTKDDQNVSPDFKKIVDEYNSFNTKYTILIPLEGIKLQIPQLLIGNLKINTINEEYLKMLKEKNKSIASRSKGDARMISASIEGSLSKLENEVCAQIEKIAEPRRAIELAHEELSLVLDLLRYSASILTPDFHKVKIGLKEDFNRGVRPDIAFSEDEIFIDSIVVGSRAPFIIDDKVVQDMDKLGVFLLGRYIDDKTNLPNSKFLETILVSIHWHAHALELDNISDKILNFTTSIECFFETKDKPIAKTLSEGMAFIFQDDYERRIELKKEMNRLYNLRSKISHGGIKEITEEDVGQLRHLSFVLIDFAIIYKDIFISKPSFNSWVDSLRMGLSNKPLDWHPVQD